MAVEGERSAAIARAPRGSATDPAAPTLVIASAGTLLVLFAFASVITTAAESVTALHAGASTQTWALSGMSLGLATSLLSFGVIADDYGRRRVFRGGCVGLAAASALGAAAPTPAIFVAARILQGVAGAAVLSASLGLIGNAFPSGIDRTRATGVWGASIGAGTASGPLVAAALAMSLDWRAGYMFQAAVAVVLALASGSLPESRTDRRRSLDVGGALAFAAAAGCMTAGLTLGRENWSGTSTVVLLGLAAASLLTFVLLERRRRDAMIDLALFRRPAFFAASLGATLTGLTAVALMSTMPSVLERALKQTPLACAGLLACFSLTGTAVAVLARRLPLRFRAPQRLVCGFMFSAVGLAAVGGLDPGSSWTQLLPGLLLIGVGYGLSNAALGRLAVDTVPASRAGTGSGANNTARYLGGAAGVALIAAVIAAGDSGDGAAGLLTGWNLACDVCGGAALAAAIVIWACFRLDEGTSE